MNGNAARALEEAKRKAHKVVHSADYSEFVDKIRRATPWRFQLPAHILERDYLRIVDHHLNQLIPLVQPYVEPQVRRVIDFGCGSGGSAIALTMVCPDVYCCGTDIDPGEIAVAKDRAQLYGVADRCEFHHVEPCQTLPFPDQSFDLSLCSSVLEYATQKSVRRFCVREMVRLVGGGGVLFFSVPNKLYPFEIHTRKWGWNYFPELLHADTVDSTYWEVLRLAHPAKLRLYRTPLIRLLTPWTNFCLRKEGDY
jgi:SAM-dependent methyltransferase